MTIIASYSRLHNHYARYKTTAHSTYCASRTSHFALWVIPTHLCGSFPLTQYRVIPSTWRTLGGPVTLWRQHSSLDSLVAGPPDRLVCVCVMLVFEFDLNVSSFWCCKLCLLFIILQVGSPGLVVTGGGLTRPLWRCCRFPVCNSVVFVFQFYQRTQFDNKCD